MEAASKALWIGCLGVLLAQNVPTATSIKVQADTGTSASSDCQAENDKLKAEIQQLRREVYVLNMRKDNCPMGGLLGEWDGPVGSHLNEAENFGKCYPKAAKAMFCMNGFRGDATVNPQFLHCDSTGSGAQWDPPKNPRHAKPKEVSNAPISTFSPIASITTQFEPLQFPHRLFERMEYDPIGRVIRWSYGDVRTLLSMLESGEDVSPKTYPEAMKDMKSAMSMIPQGLANKTVLVVGSITPWLESIALHLGAKEVTTTDYNLPDWGSDLKKKLPQLKRGRLLPEMVADVNSEQYDVILSYSSIEHDGLGRYGDPIFPNGDLAAMQEIYLLLKPGGSLMLGVPSEGVDENQFYSQRVYGPVRFPVLLRGWNYRGAAMDGNVGESFLLERHDQTNFSTGFGIHSVVMLQKPSVAPETLDDLYGEEECTIKCDGQGNPSSRWCRPSGNACHF